MRISQHSAVRGSLSVSQDTGTVGTDSGSSVSGALWSDDQHSLDSSSSASSSPVSASEVKVAGAVHSSRSRPLLPTTPGTPHFITIHVFNSLIPLSSQCHLPLSPPYHPPCPPARTV